MKKLILIILLLVVSISLRAADKYVRITTDDGLQSNYITSICRDSIGFIWIGTSEGLSRFDGVNVKRYEFLDEAGQPSILRVNHINRTTLEDKAGLLIATSKGLYAYDSLRDRFNLSYSSQHQILSLHATQGSIFMGSESGLIVKAEGSIEAIHLLSGERILSLGQSGQTIYVLTPTDLYAINAPSKNQSGSFEFKLLKRLSQGNYSSMLIDGETIYIGTDRSGIIQYDTTSNSANRLEEVTARIIRKMVIKSNILYITTDGDGVIQYNTSTKEVVAQNLESSDAISNSATCIDVDYKGLIWVGSYSNGLFFSQPVDDFISIVPATSGFSARAIHREEDDHFIIGSRSGLMLWQDGERELFVSEDYSQIQSNIIISILPLADDNYIIGTYGGGAFLFGSHSRKISSLDAVDPALDNILQYESIYDMAKVDEAIYFFTLKGLIRYSSSEGVEHWDDKNSPLPSPLIYSQCYDESSKIFWIGTSNGLCKFDIATRQIIPVSFETMDNNFRINSITLDSNNDLLVDRNYSELYRVNTSTMESSRIYFMANSSDHISGIVEDNNLQYLWIATTNGLYRYDIDREQSIKFIRHSGLHNTNICPNAILKLDDNKIFIGTEGGLYKFQPKESTAKNFSRTIHLSSVSVNGVESLEKVLNSSNDIVDNQQQYIIKINNGDLVEFDMVDPTFRKVQEFKYAISIGSDEWQYLDSNHFKLKERLPIGRYRIRAKVVSDNGNWSEPIDVGYLIISLRTGVTILLGVLALALILYAIFWRAIRKIIVIKQRKDKGNKSQLQNGEPTSARSKQVIEIIKSSLESSKAYKNPKFRLADLADLTGVSSNEISQVLNKDLNMSFTDFVNDYRVEEVKKLLCEDDANYFILHVLAERCGFNSKASFYRIFKSKTGFTPLQYRRDSITEK